MPVYEYRCRACGDTFDQLRPMASADEPADCACGRGDTVRMLSLIAPSAASGDAPVGGGGGCCGGGCCG